MMKIVDAQRLANPQLIQSHGLEGSYMYDVPVPGLLVSMPSLSDPFFQKTVILLCDYNEETAFGVVINRPTNLVIGDILAENVALERGVDTPVLIGGPVQPEFFWAIHGPDFADSSTNKVSPLVHLTSVHEVLFSVSQGLGPGKFHVGCGYAGWGPGQLDRELEEGSWWVAPLDPELVMHMPYEDRWEHVLKSIGIDPAFSGYCATGEA